jgi:hypothetical protein
MTGRPTDHKNIDLYKLNLDVAFGRANGMIIWQPRILCWFTDKEFEKIPLPERYRNMDRPAIFRDLECSTRVYDYNDCFKIKYSPKIIIKDEPIDESKTRHIIKTPIGEVFSVTEKSPNSWARITRKWLIETPNDMKIATWILDNSDWYWDQDTYDKIFSIWGDISAEYMFMPRVNVQNLYIDSMGVEHAIYAIYEWGEIVNEYFRALHENHLRMIEVINKSPIKLICFGDNIHCSTLSPSLYEKYVLPVYIERCNKLHKANKFVFSHWDGNVKALLKFAKVSGLDGIEAITPKPQGDVTLEEIKEALGNEIYLIDGIPAILFDKIFAEKELIECTKKLIKLFAPKLILGISDEISSTGDIERIRIVGKIVDDYNAWVSKK